MAQTPTCPRCGYDLSGIVASWTNSCPLAGICSECGHPLRWVEVLDPKAQLVRWFIEHPFPGRHVLGRAMATWFWIIAPWVFWNRVGMKSPVSKWRMVLWLVLPLVTIHLIAGVARSATIWQFWPPKQPLPLYDLLPLNLIVAWLGPFLGITIRGLTYVVAPIQQQWPYPVTVLLAISLGMPLLLLMLSGTRKACRLRRAHVWRAMGYGFAWLVVLAAARAVSYIDTLAGIFPVSNASPWWAFVRGNNWIDIQIHEYPWRWGSVLIAWCIIWWWCAIARGFRLPDAGIIWSLLMIACLLLAGVLLIKNPTFLLEYFG